MAVGDTLNRFGELARKTNSQIMEGRAFSVGRATTFIRYTKTVDTMGRASAISTSSYSIVGDLQPVTADDHELIAQGWAQGADAAFYTYDSSGLGTVPKEGDKLLGPNNDYWEIVAKMESPKIGDFEVQTVWRTHRRDQSGGTDSF